MRILLAGGGSGGHVTPLRAISQSLRRQAESKLELTVISDRKFFGQTEFLFQSEPEVQLKQIYSGKFRRYNGKSLLWHVVHLPTLLHNLGDVFLIGLGILQSIHYFLWHKPDVVFCKGGYVCVPIGLAARLFKVPLVIHDSDTHPGLTNRFLSRWAVKIGTGMPARYYHYPKGKMAYTGIPVSEGFKPANRKQQQQAKTALKLDPAKPLLLVTGGGTGAKALNSLLVRTAAALLEADWQIVQLAGQGKAEELLATREQLPAEAQQAWQILEFAEILPLVQAADVIISRAGATAMQEFANAGKAVVVVPSPYLTGGHQLKNAALFAENGAAVVLQEADLKQAPDVLVATVNRLLKNPAERQALASRLAEAFAKPQASDEIAAMVLSAGSPAGSE